MPFVLCRLVRWILGRPFAGDVYELDGWGHVGVRQIRPWWGSISVQPLGLANTDEKHWMARREFHAHSCLIEPGGWI